MTDKPKPPSEQDDSFEESADPNTHAESAEPKTADTSESAADAAEPPSAQTVTPTEQTSDEHLSDEGAATSEDSSESLQSESLQSDSLTSEEPPGKDLDAAPDESPDAVETTAPQPDPHGPEQASPAPDVQSDTPEGAGDAQGAAPVPIKSGRAPAWLAVFIALSAAAGVGYLYYQLVYLDPLDQITAQQNQAAASVSRLNQEVQQALSQLRDETGQQLADASNTQTEQLQQVTEQVRQNLADALQAAPPSRREWKLAEAEYLMRIANHRVLMEDDAEGALVLLLAADQILEELDDFSLYTVRARLSDEVMALRRVKRDDLQGIYLRIESIKSSLNQLQFAQPVMQAPQPEPVEELTFAERVWEGLAEFIRFRSLASDETVKPLLAPEEERFLELNLRLALQQAQLAVLERQQDVYLTSLDSAAAWIEGYMSDDEAARAVVTQLKELVQVDLERQLPEISGSLNELRTIMQTGEAP